ncbi:MAG: ATP-binding protein [Candidatus Delongbacteria bacterium]|nr:ATP-binding protein [Candidatus Delongbacteria bacterium]
MKANNPHNPFLISGYFSPEYFCDRIDETTKIISALDNDRNISLISPRRFGKTGLVQHVFDAIRHKDEHVLCIYMDIYSTQNLNDFVKVFAEEVLSKVHGGVENAIKKIASYFKSFRPLLSYDPISGNPELSIRIDTDSTEISLKEIVAYLQQSKKRCYIAIDEFQQVADYPEKGTEALLRSYIQFLPNVKFIFAGSRQHIMNEIFLSIKRPFYQSTQIMSIGVIQKEAYFSFVIKHFQKNGFSFDKKCFDELYDLLDGHTWYMQAVLNRLYEYRQDIQKPIEIYNAVGELLDENAYTYQEFLYAYTLVQKTLIKAVAKEKVVTRIHSGEFISKYGLKNSSSVSRALNSLLDSELIYKSDKGYMVYDRFFGLWLSRLR